MNKTFVKDLDELVQANIISAGTAQHILHYYQNKAAEKPNRFPIIVNVLGALLASLGIILVIAHNWDELGRFSKTIIAFLPLLLGQGLCIYTLLKQKNSIAWKETSAVVLFFGIASCISLISQTYNISGELSSFLLVWMLLAIPLVYIMPSAVTALLYIGGITWYACEVGYFGYSRTNSIPYYYIGLLALIGPHFYLYWKNRKDSNRFILLAWMITLSLTIALGAFSESSYNSPEWVSCAYIAMFCVFYLAGRSEAFEDNRLFANPFLSIGALGILFILFFWSFEGIWTSILHPYYDKTGKAEFFYAPFFYLSFAMLLIAIWLIVMHHYKRVSKVIFDPMGFSGMLLFLLLLVAHGNPQFGTLIINAWILFVAVFFIRKGAITDHLGILNFGLTIIALLAMFRFFDDQIPFVWRGLFFLATGIGFFVANYLMVKKRKELKG
ncbi:MAG: DUF2157 domain-containing protein [Agriterribacter sp.]